MTSLRSHDSCVSPSGTSGNCGISSMLPKTSSYDSTRSAIRSVLSQASGISENRSRICSAVFR